MYGMVSYVQYWMINKILMKKLTQTDGKIYHVLGQEQSFVSK